MINIYKRRLVSGSKTESEAQAVGVATGKATGEDDGLKFDTDF